VIPSLIYPNLIENKKFDCCNNNITSVPSKTSRDVSITRGIYSYKEIATNMLDCSAMADRTFN
jgi:hypothetical protein